jgi:predicted transcriptional regulator
MKIQTLTKAEEQVMQYLWKIEKGFLKDILDLFPSQSLIPIPFLPF